MKKISAIITGISGQDGAYLADFLLKKKNYKVIGVTSPSAAKNKFYRLDYFGIRRRVKMERGNILDDEFLRNILKKYQPGEFYNLAGQSSVAKSWENPEITFKINAEAVEKILLAIKKYSPRAKFLQCSSAEMYSGKKIITENSRDLAPLNPYGASKLRAHLSVQEFRAKYGMFAVNGIFLNHVSPLSGDHGAAKKITRAATRIAKGLEKSVSLGDLNVSRDWGYAGDFVEAMWLMLQQEKPRDIVVCTGRNHTLQEFTAEAFKQAGIKNWKKFVKIDKGLFRKKEIKIMRGSPALAKKLLGWRPKVDFKELVRLMVAYENK